MTTRTSLLSGQFRAATSCKAASAFFDPSRPTIKRTGKSGSSSFPRATRTEQRASFKSHCEMLPRNQRPIALRPCEPTTMRSAFQPSAFANSSQFGEPQIDSCFTFQFGKLAWNCSAASSANSAASLTTFDPDMYLRSSANGPFAVAAISTISYEEGGGGGSHTSATLITSASPAGGNPA